MKDEATWMTPEDESQYWRDQYEHKARECEEVRDVLRRTNLDMSDAYATVRTLVRMARSLGMEVDRV